MSQAITPQTTLASSRPRAFAPRRPDGSVAHEGACEHEEEWTCVSCGRIFDSCKDCCAHEAHCGGMQRC